MATVCPVCGKKLSPLSDKGYRTFKCQPKMPICIECDMLIDTVEAHRIKSEQGLAAYSRNVDELKRKASDGAGFPDVKAEMLALVEEINAGYPTYLDYQAAIFEQSFPAESSHYFGRSFVVNQSAKTFAIIEDGWRLSEVHPFSDLIDYNVTEDGASLTSGRAGAAAAGALLAGAAGAIVGSSMSKKTEQLVSQLDIVLSYKGLDAPLGAIKLIGESVSKSSKLYAEKANLCNQIVSTLKQILEENESAGVKKERGARAIYAFSVAGEISKFKQLMDDGVITQAEFEAQKQKLLSLDY